MKRKPPAITIMLCQTEQCTGCGACANACPFDAVAMQPDRFGFFRPAIDGERCTQCKRCVEACPVLHPPELPRKETPGVFACWNRDGDTLEKSTSGGMFSIFAEKILDDGGVVFGAAFDESMALRHVVASDRDGMAGMRKSKYVQSHTGSAYSEVKRYLDKKTPVLFSGTPCQVAGLYGFLGGDHERLLTCGLICGGVPSQKMFRRYLSDVETKLRKKVTGIDFRDKSNGWETLQITIRFEDGTESTLPSSVHPYGKGFYRHYMQNDSCYSCVFRTVRRASDITLGDFWRIGEIAKKRGFPFPLRSGVSIVLVHSEKGMEIFRREQHRFQSHECGLEDAVAGSSRIAVQPIRPADRADFLSRLDSDTFEELERRYFPSRSKFLATGIALFRKLFGASGLRRIKGMIGIRH